MGNNLTTVNASTTNKPLQVEQERTNEEMAVALINRLVKYKSHRLQIKQALGLAKYKGQGKMSADHRKHIGRVYRDV